MKLSDMLLTDFVETLASEAPAPGGGSAAALYGAMGSGLAAMVACLTQGRKKYADYAVFAAHVRDEESECLRRLLDVMNRDTEAFQQVSAAFALPRDSEEQKAARSAAIQEGLRASTLTPMECMELSAKALEICRDFLNAGFNTSSASDLGVAFLSLKSAIQGAWLNVLINISSIKDPDFVRSCRSRGEALLARAVPMADEGYSRVLLMIEQ